MNRKIQTIDKFEKPGLKSHNTFAFHQGKQKDEQYIEKKRTFSEKKKDGCTFAHKITNKNNAPVKTTRKKSCSNSTNIPYIKNVTYFILARIQIPFFLS